MTTVIIVILIIITAAATKILKGEKELALQNHVPHREDDTSILDMSRRKEKNLHKKNKAKNPKTKPHTHIK